MNKKKLTSMRLSVEAKTLIEAMAEKLGISQTAVMEIAVRRLAEKEHVSPKSLQD